MPAQLLHGGISELMLVLFIGDHFQTSLQLYEV